MILIMFANGKIALAVFIAISSQLPGINILDPVKEILTNIASVHRTKQCMNELENSFEKIIETDKLPKSYEICINNVSFHYPDSDCTVLSNINYTFLPQKRYAIVGVNGAGKSTLIRILVGLLHPSEGDVTVGGIPVQNMSDSVRSSIFGCAFQDYVRFCLSLRENINLGKENDVPLILNSLDIAGLLPNGYDTLIGKEYGDSVDLSGGQWQSVSLLRALTGDRNVLVFDEPTAALDPINEYDTLKEIIHQTDGKTLIFVTHRLGITKEVDEILVINDNCLVEAGSFRELYAKKGLFHTMFEAQRQLYQKEEN